MGGGGRVEDGPRSAQRTWASRPLHLPPTRLPPRPGTPPLPSPPQRPVPALEGADEELKPREGATAQGYAATSLQCSARPLPLAPVLHYLAPSPWLLWPQRMVVTGGAGLLKHWLHPTPHPQPAGRA